MQDVQVITAVGRVAIVKRDTILQDRLQLVIVMLIHSMVLGISVEWAGELGRRLQVLLRGLCLIIYCVIAVKKRANGNP